MDVIREMLPLSAQVLTVAGMVLQQLASHPVLSCDTEMAQAVPPNLSDQAQEESMFPAGGMKSHLGPRLRSL